MTVTVKVNIPNSLTEGDLNQLTREPISVPSLAKVTPADLPKVVDALKQIIEVREGTRSSFVERNVTWRDLIGMGMVDVSVNGVTYNGTTGGVGTPGGGGGVVPGPGGGETPNFTPPPAPTGFRAEGAMNTVLLVWDTPTYGWHGYTEIWRADANVIGEAVLVGTASGSIYADDLGPADEKYYWIRFMSKWGVTGPYNATNGTQASTGEDIDYILSILQGQITESQLHQDLGDKIDMIDTLAIEVSQISAGGSSGFDTFKVYYFDSGAEGWVADTDATVTTSPSYLNVDATGSAPSIKLDVDLSPGIAGGNYPVVKARIKRTAGSGWAGILQWKTSGHGFGSGNQLVAADPSVAVDDYAIIEWSLEATADWTSSTILNLRIELGADASDDFAIDWIAIGRNAPAASVAMLGDEASTRATADSAEVTARQLLSTKVLGTNDPSSITGLNDLSSGLIYEEKAARATGDSAIASSVTTLQTTVNQNTASIQTQQTSIDGLKAQYTVKIDVNGYVAGFGLASTPAEAGGQTSTFAVRADTFYVASPTGPGIPPTMPFMVKTTSWTAGGKTNLPGVYMDAAFIGLGQIGTAQIGLLAVDDANIASLNAAKINAGTINADRLDSNIITAKVASLNVAKLVTGIVGGDIYSQSYASGASGWVLLQNGNAQFNNVGLFNAYMRGEINGGAFTGYAWPPIHNYGFHLGPNGLLLGNANNGQYVQITSLGQLFAPGLTIADGNAWFSGILSAATGSFSGSLNAATGTFSGSLTAAAVNAVNSINIAQNALIIPVSAETLSTFAGNGVTWQNICTAQIALSEFTKLFITANCHFINNANFVNPSADLLWGLRIIRMDGTPIITTGPAVFGYNGNPPPFQSCVSLARQWAEGEGLWNFTLQFWGNGGVVAAYPTMSILGTRRS